MANHNHKHDKQQHDKPALVTTATSAAAPTDDTRAVIVPAVLHFALDLVDRGQITAIGALHDARTEIRVAVDGGLELADKASAAALRFARKLAQRVDDLAAESLGGAERVLTSTVASVRSSAIAAAARLGEREISAQITAPPVAQA